jgi:hypothetical protein
MGQPGAKEKVREIYLHAHAVKGFERLFPTKVQWRVCFNQKDSNGINFRYAIGLGDTSKKAWANAWQSIQKTMLRKLES